MRRQRLTRAIGSDRLGGSRVAGLAVIDDSIKKSASAGRIRTGHFNRMSSHPQEPPTNRPESGAVMEARGYTFAVAFHPPIRLDQKKGYAFAASLSGTGLITPEQTQITEQGWRFGQPLGDSPRSGMMVQVGQGQLVFNIAFPSHRQEWFETRFRGILDKFGAEYKPQLLMQSVAAMQVTLKIDGDARTFLFENIAHFNMDRLSTGFSRPIQVVGLRLGFPPFELKVKEKGKKPKKRDSAEWGLELKIESLAEDPSQLFLSAEGTWPQPDQWNADTIHEATGRLATLNDFLISRVLPYLRNEDKGDSE